MHAAVHLFYLLLSRTHAHAAVTVHQYPLNHGSECTLAGALNRTNTERLVPTFEGTFEIVARSGAVPPPLLVLEETAGSSGGG